MPRVIGIDPGTITIDLCGLDDGLVFIDRSLPTAQALADPAALVAALEPAQPLDLIAGPSGYGLPLTAARDLTDTDIRLAYLAAAGEDGGIGGLRSLMHALARSNLPIVVTPGVIHLSSVPSHRKVNRVDMGTADKVCAAVLAIREQAMRHGCAEHEVSFVLLELGGAFTAGLAVQGGRIVDGMGGTSGPLGLRAAGALDGEVAFLAGAVSKRMLFEGGAASIAGTLDAPQTIASPGTNAERVAWDAYVESAAKAVAALSVSIGGGPIEVLLSGRFARIEAVREELTRRLGGLATAVWEVTGFAVHAKQGAQGAALLADGLAGGTSAALVERLGIREARGTVLDHLYVISAAAARARLGLSS
jgi:predicted butyrate kinase (DUF1464 family)